MEWGYGVDGLVLRVCRTSMVQKNYISPNSCPLVVNLPLI